MQFQCALERQCGHSFTRKFPMQMYALRAQSGTTVLYHSWAGLVATMNKSHGAQQDSSARIANNLGKTHDSSPTRRYRELCSAYLIYTTSTLTLVGLQRSNNKTINVSLLVKHWICPHLLPVSLLKIDHKLVCTNPMLHTEPYNNYYLPCNQQPLHWLSIKTKQYSSRLYYQSVGGTF